MKNILINYFKLILLLLLFYPLKPSLAQQLILDTSLDGDGVKTLNPNFYGSAISSVAQQVDGKIVCGGTGTEQLSNKTVYTVSRYHLNGDLDTSFGVNGFIQNGFDTVLSVCKKLLIQPDGKILITGYTGSNPTGLFGITRLNTDGSLDSSFNQNGTALFDITPDDDIVTDMLLQPDDKIVLGGYSTNGNGTAGSFLIRLLTDGSLDTSFNNNGIVQNPNYLTAFEQMQSLALQPDGKLITLSGTQFNFTNRHLIKRYNANGTIDSAFATNGTLIPVIGIIEDITGLIRLQPDGKFIVAGYSTIPSGGMYSYSDLAIGRFNTDGSIDSTFNFDGRLVIPIGHKSDVPTAVQLDSLGNVFIAGYTDNGPPCQFCIDYDMFLVKLNSNGIPDLTFGSQGMFMFNWGMQDNIAWDMIIQQDGKFLLVGDFSFGSTGSQMALVRLVETITSIPSFSANRNIIVAPNPFMNLLQLHFKKKINGYLKISDVTGRTIYFNEVKQEQNINTHSWKNGVYVYDIVTDDKEKFHGQLIKAGH